MIINQGPKPFLIGEGEGEEGAGQRGGEEGSRRGCTGTREDDAKGVAAEAEKCRMEPE